MRGTWAKESDSKPRIRHLAAANSDGSGFGDHYVTNDKSLPTADQWIVDTYPTGDNRRLLWDPFRDTPHVVIRTWSDATQKWTEVSVTGIAR
jgi:hypothetical protein